MGPMPSWVKSVPGASFSVRMIQHSARNMNFQLLLETQDQTPQTVFQRGGKVLNSFPKSQTPSLSITCHITLPQELPGYNMKPLLICGGQD